MTGPGPIRIAMIDPSGFTLQYDHHLSDALAHKGLDLTLYSREAREDEEVFTGGYRRVSFFYPLSERLKHRQSTDVVINYIKGLEHAYDMARLVRHLRRGKPELIHFQWLPLPIVDLYSLPQLAAIAPLVLTVHDTRPFNTNPTSRVQILGWRRTLDPFRCLIVHTQYSKDRLIRAGISDAKVTIIPHGPFEPLGPVQAIAVPADEHRVLFFGSIKPYKGVDCLIRAVALLPEPLRARTRVQIVGRPSAPMEALRGLSASLGLEPRIDWDLRHVPQTELPALFATASVVVFPYREIDASGALVTALPFGRPIIATMVGGFPELLEDGVHGRLVPPDDPRALADALTTVLAEPETARAMGQNVRALADALPSWSEIADRAIGVYYNLIKKHGPGLSGLGPAEHPPTFS